MKKIYFLLVLVLIPSFAHAQYYGNPLGLVREWQDGMIYGMQSLMRPGYGPQYYGGGYPVVQQPAPCGYTIVENPKEKVSVKAEIGKALGSASVGALLGYGFTGSGQGAARGAALGGATYGSIELAKRYLRQGQVVVPAPCQQQQGQQQDAYYQQIPTNHVYRDRGRSVDTPAEFTFVNQTEFLVTVFVDRQKICDLEPGETFQTTVPKLLGTEIQGVAAKPRRDGSKFIYERFNLLPEKSGSKITFVMPTE